tara:strand:- start:1097 stop:2782 length:1686 start_codon:yes stop_codon:yes gene_type:complete
MGVIKVIGLDAGRKIPPATQSDVDQLIRRYHAAKAKTAEWHAIVRECYDFCIPNRSASVDSSARPGQEVGQRVVDGTAVESIYGFANELQSALLPSDTEWIRMRPGAATDPKELSDVAHSLDYWNTIAFEDINDSNFSSSAHEAMLDIGVGTAAIRVIGGDARQRLIYETIPLPDIVVEAGPYGTIENVYRPYNIPVKMITRRWPFAELDADVKRLIEDQPETPVDLIEVCVFHPVYQTYRTVVILLKNKKAIFQTAADESEYVVSRWAVAPGEVLGRGVAMSALPFIRTLNRAMRLTIAISELSIAGMYTGVGDGVFNPHNVEFKPGAIFPVEDADAGLKPIAQSHDFQITQELMSEWRGRIKAIMFQEEAAPIERGSQPSATAAILRSEKLQAKIGGSFPRLFRELVNPIFKKSVFQLQLQGRLPKDLRINGHDVRTQYTGPLAQASRMDGVKAVQSTLEVVGGLLGPEMIHAHFKTEEIGRFIAHGFGMPESLIRDEADVKETMAKAVSAQTGQTATVDPTEGAGPMDEGAEGEPLPEMPGGVEALLAGGGAPGGLPN